VAGGVEPSGSCGYANTVFLCLRVPVQIEGDFALAALHRIQDLIESRLFHRFTLALPSTNVNAATVRQSPIDLAVYHHTK
jgi:hypothetical protein